MFASIFQKVNLEEDTERDTGMELSQNKTLPGELVVYLSLLKMYLQCFCLIFYCASRSATVSKLAK